MTQIILEVMGWIAAVGSIVANLLVAQKNKLGFQVWTFATFILFVLAILEKESSKIFLFGVYELLNIYGWIRWEKEESNIN